MTFHAGEILIEGREGSVYTEHYDSIQTTESRVICLTREVQEDGIETTVEKVVYPLRRVEMVRLDLEE